MRFSELATIRMAQVRRILSCKRIINLNHIQLISQLSSISVRARFIGMRGAEMTAACQHNFAIAVVVVIFRNVKSLWESNQHTFISFVASWCGGRQGQLNRFNGLTGTTDHHCRGAGRCNLGQIVVFTHFTGNAQGIANVDGWVGAVHKDTI